jgi:hypothetical protein
VELDIKELGMKASSFNGKNHTFYIYSFSAERANFAHKSARNVGVLRKL